MKSLSAWQAEFEKWWQGHGHNDDGSHDISHFRRVYKVACDIAAGEGGQADLCVLLAAAYFHDLVNPPKNSPLRAKASTLSAEQARGILSSLHFPVNKLDAVAHAIAAHSFSANIPANTLEAKILQDADRMEALGALGIARNMYVSGKMNSKLFHADDPLGETRALDDKAYALDHFELKLLKLPDMMQTETGRAIARERAAFLIVFRNQLLKEIAA